MGAHTALARDDERGLTAQVLNRAKVSLDAALANMDTDVEAAKDDVIAARLLLATALLQ